MSIIIQVVLLNAIYFKTNYHDSYKFTHTTSFDNQFGNS